MQKIARSLELACVRFGTAVATAMPTKSCAHTKQKQVATAATASPPPSILLQQEKKRARELNPEDNLMLFLVHICSMNQPQKLVFRINSENL